MALATEIARAAGALLVEYESERGSLVAQTKSTRTDLVSAADRASETLIRERIVRSCPDDAILGEEDADRPGTSGRTWVVDPLDGTTNFLFGLPIWAVSIACEDAEGPSAACVFDPSREELFSAGRGLGTSLNGERVEVSTRDVLGEALIATGFHYDSDLRRSQAEQLESLIARVRDVRRCGAASLDLAWVACGRFDGFYEAGLGRWDWSAGSLLVQEAGGSFMRGTGPHGVDQVVASNGVLASELEQLAS